MPQKTCPHCNKKIPPTRRAPNAYNEFVREAMQKEEIKKLDPKSRMKAVANLWNQQKK
jgi:hypothetical protein